MCGRQDENIERLEIMGKSNDGFLVAQKDLELRVQEIFWNPPEWGYTVYACGYFFQDAEIFFEKTNSFLC